MQIDRIGIQYKTQELSEFDDTMTGTIPQLDCIIKTTDNKIYKTTYNLNSTYTKPDGTLYTTTDSKEPLGATMMEKIVPQTDKITEGNLSDRSWKSVCYGNDKFVAVASDDNMFAYSTDGITWTEGTISNTSRYWYSVCYGNGKFVAVASDDNCSASITFSPTGLIQYATPAKDLTWNNIENKPNTLAGYNITNCYTRDEINNLYNEIINSLTDIQTRATALIDEVTVTIPDDFDTTITMNKEKSADINYKINLLIKNANMDTELASTIYNLVNN